MLQAPFLRHATESEVWGLAHNITGKLLATQAFGPRFSPQNALKKLGMDCHFSMGEIEPSRFLGFKAQPA